MIGGQGSMPLMKVLRKLKYVKLLLLIHTNVYNRCAAID